MYFCRGRELGGVSYIIEKPGYNNLCFARGIWRENWTAFAFQFLLSPQITLDQRPKQRNGLHRAAANKVNLSVIIYVHDKLQYFNGKTLQCHGLL